MRVTLGMYSPQGEPIPNELTIGRETLVPLEGTPFDAAYFMADVLLDPAEDSSRLDMSISLNSARGLMALSEDSQNFFEAEIVGSIEMDGSFRFLAGLPYKMEFEWGREGIVPGLILVRYPAEIILKVGIRRYESTVRKDEFFAALDALVKTSGGWPV